MLSTFSDQNEVKLEVNSKKVYKTQGLKNKTFSLIILGHIQHGAGCSSWTL